VGLHRDVLLLDIRGHVLQRQPVTGMWLPTPQRQC
jgi:hypothetical protein